MIRKFKALGLAMVAVLAMSAVVSSAAQAQFTADKYPTAFKATSALGNDVFTVDGTSVECAGEFTGEAGEASTTINVTAHYTSCKAFGFATATVAMNGCKYIFHDTAGGNEAGQVTITCPEGKVITITSGACEVQVGAQGPLGSLTYTNVGEKEKEKHIGVKANVSNITANRTKDGFLCPLTGTGHVLSTYKQGAAVTVEPTSGGTDLTVD